MIRCPLCNVEVYKLYGHVCSINISKEDHIVPLSESFDEVINDIPIDGDWAFNIESIIFKYLVKKGEDCSKVKISCKEGKIVIERID